MENWSDVFDAPPVMNIADLPQPQRAGAILSDGGKRLLYPPDEILESSTLSIPRPQTDDELIDLTERLLGIKLSRVSCCTGHVAPATAFCDAYFAKSDAAVWKAARGLGGKSFMLAALAWMESVTLRASVTVLGGSGEQSARVHEYTRGFWMRPQVPIDVLIGDTTQRKVRLAWGNVVEAQLASQRSVRGAHPQRLRVDEADEVEWRICEAARGQAMGKGDIKSHVVYSSTHQNADGTMTKLLQEAAQKGWPVFEWCYRETLEPHGWLTQLAMERYRRQVSAELWRVEVELGEPSPEGRAILPECVEKMFGQMGGAYVRRGERYDFGVGEAIRDVEGEYYEFEAPLPDASYAGGIDWGSKQDETVIVTLRTDVMPMRLVAYEHLTRRPMPFMIERAQVRVRRFPGMYLHDATGVGTWQADFFEEYIDNYVMTPVKRNDLFQTFITGVESSEVVSPKLLSFYHALKYAKNRDLYTQDVADAHGVKKGHPPDALVAGAMAYMASTNARHPLRIGGSTTTAPLPTSGTSAPTGSGGLNDLFRRMGQKGTNGHAGSV